ncbi:hypothetical protein ABH940_006119 [Streptacidiphilus sp. BW17]
MLSGTGVNIKRNPLCGRNIECFSEDAHVGGVMGAALVNGIQSLGVGACVKHSAVNSQETDRMRVSAQVDEQTLREIYLPAFAARRPPSPPDTVTPRPTCPSGSGARAPRGRRRSRTGEPDSHTQGWPKWAPAT